MLLMGHIVSSVINLGFGLIIGILLHALFNLFVTNWITGMFAVILSAILLLGLFVIETIIDWLFERIFPSGIRASHRTTPKKPKPLLRRLAMPVGFALGLLLAEFDMASLDQVNQILEFIS
jgi:hypothetical protein